MRCEGRDAAGGCRGWVRRMDAADGCGGWMRRVDAAPSGAAEMGLSLFEKGGGPFFHVFGGEAFAEGLLFAEEAVVAVADGYGVSRRDIGAFDDTGDGDRGFLINDGEDLAGFGEELVLFGDDIVYEAQGMRFGGVDHTAGEHDLESTAFSDELHQSLRAAISGNDAKVDLGLSEFCIGRTQPEMAGHGQL